MRIIAITDIHNSFKKLQAILSHEDGTFEAVVLGGDITTFGTASTIEDAIRIAQSFGKPVYAVTGNMDPTTLDDSISQFGVSINARGVMLKDVGFFGISASPFSPLHTPNEVSEEEIMSRVESGWKDVAAAKIKILVSHTPPHNTRLDVIHSGAHVGSTAVRTFIETHQPDVVICGHIHEASGVDSIGKTRSINCGAGSLGRYGVIELAPVITMWNKSLSTG
jgi:Icc-related predicted phosphoesterase